jgi:peroxiredoxin
MRLHFYIIIILFVFVSRSVFAEEHRAKEGLIAPDFEIVQMDGATFKLSDYQGKKSVYVVFWNTWCGYCMKKIPKLKQIESNLSDQIKIIAINTTRKDSVAQSIVFQKQHEINYSLAFDYGKKVTDLYNVWGTPTEFIIDINGIIQHRDHVPKEIASLLEQWNEIKPSEHMTEK